MFEKLKQAWKRDPLAVLGVGSAVVAFLLWAMPSPSFGISFSQYRCDNGMSGGSAYSLVVVQVISGCLDDRYDRVIGAEGWFTLERLPAIVSSLALGAFLFYVSVRRRGRAKQVMNSHAPQTLAVAIVSATVSALVVTGAGLMLVNQVPRKSVFQTIYREPTPTPQPFLTPSPSPSPTPTPKPTKAPLRRLSERESAVVKMIIEDFTSQFEDTLKAEQKYIAANLADWPFQLPVVKSSYTETKFIFTFTLTRWVSINPYTPFDYVPFRFTSKCVYPRLSLPYPNDSVDVWSNFSSKLFPISNEVTYDEFDGSKTSLYPGEPTRWMTTYKYKSDGVTTWYFGSPTVPATTSMWTFVKGCA